MGTRIHTGHVSCRPTLCCRNLALAAVLSCCLGVQNVAIAATWYVGPAATGNGSGQDRNNLKPMATATTSAKPGDLFLLQPGSYGEITFAKTGYGSATGGYVTYRADPNTCAARESNWFMDTLSRPSSSTSPIFSNIVFDQDYYASTGKAKPKRIEMDGLCVVGWGIGLYNQVAHVKISRCSLWGQIPEDPLYHFANQRPNGITTAPAARSGDNDFNNITVDACYVDFCAQGIDLQGNCSGDLTVSNCHVRNVAGAPLSLRPWAITGTMNAIGNHLEHGVILPWPTNFQTGYTVATANASEPRRVFTYQGPPPPTGTNRFWVKIDDLSQGISQLRPIASMDDRSVTLGAALSFDVQPGDKITFHGVMHGSGIAIWGSNVTARGNYVHDCGTTAGIFLYQKGLRNITIENNLVYDIINQYAVMLGEPGNSYSYGSNLRVVNNTFIGRRAPEYQTSPERTYGFALCLLADPATDLSTVTICNNLLIGQTWTAPAAATVRGNILYAGSGYEEDAAGPNRGNRIYYRGEAYPRQPHPFDGSGKYFVGGPGFDTYAFGASQHGYSLNDGEFVPVAGSDPVGFAYVDKAAATDITGNARGARPDTGCYQAADARSGDQGPVLAPIGDQQIATGQTLTLVVRGTGPNPADLTYSASGLPEGATFSGQTFTWTPTADQVGAYQVTFTISDSKYQDSKTITITVTKENSAPVLGAIGNESVNRNHTCTVSNGTRTDSRTIPIAAASAAKG